MKNHLMRNILAGTMLAVLFGATVASGPSLLNGLPHASRPGAMAWSGPFANSEPHDADSPRTTGGRARRADGTAAFLAKGVRH